MFVLYSIGDRKNENTKDGTFRKIVKVRLACNTLDKTDNRPRRRKARSNVLYTTKTRRSKSRKTTCKFRAEIVLNRVTRD